MVKNKSKPYGMEAISSSNIRIHAEGAFYSKLDVDYEGDDSMHNAAFVDLRLLLHRILFFMKISVRFSVQSAVAWEVKVIF